VIGEMEPPGPPMAQKASRTINVNPVVSPGYHKGRGYQMANRRPMSSFLTSANFTRETMSLSLSQGFIANPSDAKGFPGLLRESVERYDQANGPIGDEKPLSYLA
jgi:hypothetical protein